MPQTARTDRVGGPSPEQPTTTGTADQQIPG